MQKLLERNTSIPRNTSQVSGSMTYSLNKKETFSEISLKTSNNNPDVNLHQPAGESKTNVLVYVLNQDGSPLMPCKPAKARHLIQQGLPKSHSNDAFVIAGGAIQQRSVMYQCKQIRRNNCCLQLNRKGFKSSIRRRRYDLQPHCLVKYNGGIVSIKSTHKMGKRVVLCNGKSIHINSIQLYQYMCSWQCIL